MSLFVNLDVLDPHALLVAVLQRSHHSMKRAYEASFSAYLRCVQLLEDHRFGSAPGFGPLGLPLFGGSGRDEPRFTAEELDALMIEAIAEDVQADQQAAPVLLTADDALQRYAKGVLGYAPGLAEGFGPQFGSTGTPVSFTILLRAGTNTLRHVSEWDDSSKLRFPYPDFGTLSQKSPAWQPMQTISVLQQAFGLGKHSPVREVVSFRVLAAADRDIEHPSHERFEVAILEAARGIAQRGPRDALSRLEAELQRLRGK